MVFNMYDGKIEVSALLESLESEVDLIQSPPMEFQLEIMMEKLKTYKWESYWDQKF